MLNAFYATAAQRKLLSFKPQTILRCELEALRPLCGMTVFLKLQGGRRLWYKIYEAKGDSLYGHMLMGDMWRAFTISRDMLDTYY